MQNLISKDQHGNLTVTSLVIAKICNRAHKSVLASLDKFKGRHEILPSYEINELANGRRDRIFRLTERQFLIAMPFIGGINSEEGQVVLVDEFIRLREQESVKNRHIDAIRSLLLLDSPSEWEKLFPDNFFIAIMNLHGHKFTGNSSTPSYCAAIIRRWIYDIVLPSELIYEINTKRGNEKRHQWFSKENGRQTLLVQISKVEMIAQMSESRRDFDSNCARAFLGEPLQLTLFNRSDREAA